MHLRSGSGAGCMALGLTACGADEGGRGGDVEFDKGVTEEPCPDSQNEDRGCIYLGILSDITEVPFAPLGWVEIVRGQEDFWARVNERGGSAASSTSTSRKYTRDNKYNPEEHVAKLREIEPDVLALAQSLGTPPTLAALDIMKDQDYFEARPGHLVVRVGIRGRGHRAESGYNYCLEAMNGLDFMAEEFGDPQKVLHVAYPGDYGGDSAAGTEYWGEENGADCRRPSRPRPTRRPATRTPWSGRSPSRRARTWSGAGHRPRRDGRDRRQGSRRRLPGRVHRLHPDLQPGSARERGGRRPSRPSTASCRRGGRSGPTRPAHDAMAEAVGDNLPANDGYTFGWIWSYPLKAVLEQAAEGRQPDP